MREISSSNTMFKPLFSFSFNWSPLSNNITINYLSTISLFLRFDIFGLSLLSEMIFLCKSFSLDGLRVQKRAECAPGFHNAPILI